MIRRLCPICGETPALQGFQICPRCFREDHKTIGLVVRMREIKTVCDLCQQSGRMKRIKKTGPRIDACNTCRFKFYRAKDEASAPPK